MDQERWDRVKENLFPAAHAAVEPWESFPWHLGSDGVCDTDRCHSSQALAIDLFGTIRGAEVRDSVCDAIAAHLGIPSGGPWTLDLEWLDPDNRLKERGQRRTQVDVLGQSPAAAIAFECKFTETGGGPCSQPQPLRDGRNQGLIQCNGRYELQINPVNGKEARCALSGKGIRYWEAIPHIFGAKADIDHNPCPFAGPRFQWMRNLSLCYELSQARRVPTAFIVVYADGSGLPMADHVQSDEWLNFVQSVDPKTVTLRAVSFQQLTQVAVDAAIGAGADPQVWRELSAWIERKIHTAAQARTDRR